MTLWLLSLAEAVDYLLLFPFLSLALRLSPLIQHLLLLRLDELLGHAAGLFLGINHQSPQLFAEGSGVLAEKAFELDLEILDVGE